MYQKPTSTDTAKKLSIEQDAWLLFNFDKLEGKLYELGEEQSIAVEAGKERFWTNREDRTLELLVIKTRDET